MYDVVVRDRPDALVASIRMRMRPDEVGMAIPDAFRRLTTSVGRVGYGVGMPGMVVHEMGEEGADLEVFMPVAEMFEPEAGVAVRTLPGGTMATTTHVGPYDEVGPAYTALTDRVDRHGRMIVGG